MKFDLVVLGSGPGGYVAAIRAAQLGMKTAVVEKAEAGGVCLNWGCIPTKALLKSAQVMTDILHAEKFGVQIDGAVKPDFSAIIQRSRDIAGRMSKGIDYLFKKNNITLIQGFGKITSSNSLEVTHPDKSTETVEFEKLIIATGARSKALPNIPIDGKNILGYRHAMTLAEQPESMLVIGSGAIGTELGFFYNAIGTKVTIVEFLPNVLPLEDEEVSKQMARELKKRKIKLMLSSAVKKVDEIDGQCRVTIDTPKGEVVEVVDKVLSAVGVTANIEKIGLEEMEIEVERGKIKVDAHYQTNIDGIYAIGDVIATPALAHVASAEGIACVEHIAGLSVEPIDYTAIPACTYTTPEVASTGLTEKQAEENGFAVRVGKFPFTASGKATAVGHNEGFVKLVFDARTNHLLGVHMVGYNVTEMIGELILAKKTNTTGHDIIKAIHPHPTMSEAIMEAAAAAYDEVIHL